MQDTALFGGVEGFARISGVCIWGNRAGAHLVSQQQTPSLRAAASITTTLAYEFSVQIVDKDLLYPSFREAVLTVHRDELAAYALQLREGHWRRRELNWLLNLLDFDLSTSLPCVVFLVYQYLGEDVGRRFIELVEVVLFRRRFLLNVSGQTTKYF